MIPLSQKQRDFDKILGERVQTARQQRGVTQEQLSKAMGMHSSALSQYEAGKRALSAYRLAQVSFFLRMDAAAFFMPKSVWHSNLMGLKPFKPSDWKY